MLNLIKSGKVFFLNNIFILYNFFKKIEFIFLNKL